MTALILMEKESRLTLKDGLLNCQQANNISKILPWGGINHLVIGKGVDISSEVILKLAEKGVSLFFHGSKAQEVAAIMPLHGPSSSIKIQQYRFLCDKESTIKWATGLIKLKAKLQTANLLKLQLTLPDNWNNAIQAPDNINHLMLQEAHISKLYWQQLATLLQPWGFTQRIRRPPTDPVNAILSLSSVMVDSLYNHALLAQGLDIGLGFYHSTGYQRQSLICDLKELSRADLEYWVVGLFLNAILDNHHFTYVNQQCRLTPLGQTVFYKTWYRFAYLHQKRVDKIARIAKKIILREVQNAQ